MVRRGYLVLTGEPDKLPGGRQNIAQIAITGYVNGEGSKLFAVALEREGDTWKRVETVGKVPDPPEKAVP